MNDLFGVSVAWFFLWLTNLLVSSRAGTGGHLLLEGSLGLEDDPRKVVQVDQARRQGSLTAGLDCYVSVTVIYITTVSLDCSSDLLFDRLIVRYPVRLSNESNLAGIERRIKRD
jgi:hypothetical protein